MARILSFLEHNLEARMALAWAPFYFIPFTLSVMAWLWFPGAVVQVIVLSYSTAGAVWILFAPAVKDNIQLFVGLLMFFISGSTMLLMCVP